MTEKIKPTAITIYIILLSAILIGQISSRLVEYNEETNNVLDIAMFSLIGIAYLSYAWAFNKKALKLLFLSCGIYLIVMNFLDDTIYQWLAIMCVLIPLIIVKFFPEKADGGERVVD